MGKRKYDIVENYFDNIDTEEKAYFLGFLYADGYNNVKKGEVKIRLSAIDKDLLLKFRNILYPNKDRPLFYHKKKDAFELYVSNRHISTSLNSLGCVQGKSFLLSFPYLLDKSLYRHFIRGVFDGDGCISCYTILENGKERHKTTFSIIGYRAFIAEINEILAKEINTSLVKLIEYKGKDERIATLAYSGCRQCIKIREYLYKYATIYLQRKYDKFFLLGTDQWKTYDNFKQNLYKNTIKVTDSYLDEQNNVEKDFLICCQCNRKLRDHKIYDINKKIYCHSCYTSTFPKYHKLTENDIHYLSESIACLKIKNISILFDAEDFDIVNQYKWHIENGRVVCKIQKLKQYIYLNRLVMNAQSGESVAFIDGNRFNCQKSNLKKRPHR